MTVLQMMIIPATIILLISFNALYVAAEFATVAARKTRVAQMAEEGNPMARLLLPIMESAKQLDRYVAACQIGITISSLLLGMYGQEVIADLLVGPLTVWLGEGIGLFSAETLGLVIVLALITSTQVVLGELLPKSVAVQMPERIALALTVPMRISLVVLYPLIWFFNGSGNIILKAIGREAHGEGHGHVHSPQEIEILVTESHEGGLLDDEERLMLRNAFRLRDLTAKQVMIHRTRVVAASSTSTARELLRLSVETGKSRIPLYGDDIDDVQGFVHVKDVFRLLNEERAEIPAVMRPVVHVPEAMQASDVWERLRTEGQYFAIVFDEFGGTAGLITLEDLIEEIFGELQDESDDEAALLYIGTQGRLRFRWDWLVDDINEYFDLELPDEVDTVSGLVISELGRQAEEGDRVQIEGTTIRVEAMDDKGIAEVSIVDPEKPKLSDPNVHQLFIEEREAKDDG